MKRKDIAILLDEPGRCPPEAGRVRLRQTQAGGHRWRLCLRWRSDRSEQDVVMGRGEW